MGPERMAQHLQEWLQALAHIGSAVNRGVSLGELLDLIAKTACKLMSYDFCAITIPDAASQVLLIEGSYGLAADYIREINERHPLRLHGVHTPTSSSQAFAMGVPIQIEHIGSNPAALEWRSAARDQGYSSMISVPLNSADETLGTLNCYTRPTHHFTKEEEARLLMLADQAAVAITTSRFRSEQTTRITVLNQLNESLEEQHELLRQADAIHERLTALTLEGGGVSALGGALAEILDRPVAVCETNGTILYNTDRNGVSLPTALVANATGFPPADVISSGTAGLLAEVHVPDTTGTRTVVRVPVTIKEKVIAWIWTSGKISELRPLDRQAMERAAAPLALELLRIRTATQAGWRDTGEILSALLSGKGHASTALLAEAARLGHDLSLPHAVIAARFESPNEGALPYWLAATFTRLARQLSPRPLLGSHQGNVVALWPLGPTMRIDEVRGIGDEVRRIPSERAQRTDRTHAAITGPVTSIADYPSAFATARGAIDLAGLRESPPGTLVLSDLGLAGLLLQLPDVSALSHYVDDVLGPLRANGLAQDPTLLPTLSAFIHNNLDVSKTAEQLHIQEDLVVEARRRIEDLLALNLSRVSDLTRISTALEVDDVVEAKQRQSNTDL
ncbi:GAF domain-containing protein [Arthrobacter sp. BE255]|uniref:helix-turn-helix domain-containing protein n=1 Tax=Arthrobacter sp. BE255 TaxID=2817721 RepID=UPI00285777F9|nr:GAF domain-containing protein [Arthrobacter sp. BE255]MDR7161703.1 sugar diacid utilization regulator/GAF domain-containing protein [Arthrobacter sp. BE255]